MTFNQYSNSSAVGVLVTGATGFIGRALVEDFTKRPGVSVRSSVRCFQDASPLVNAVVVGNLGPETDWTNALQGLSCVVHTAAQVNPPHHARTADLGAYHRANVQGTTTLAEQAAAAGVRRFVFISTAKVLGERSASGNALSEIAPYAPHDEYANSKMYAELALLAVAEKTGMEVVIVRPPMVYGLNAKGNFGSLIRLLNFGIPLPLAGIKNLRSFLCIDNLVDFVWTCTWHPAAANQIFHVCDADDLSTPELIRALEKNIRPSVYLFHFPQRVMKIGLRLLGRMDIYQRLYDNFQLDATKAKLVMQWTPAVSLGNALQHAMVEYKK